MYRKSKEFGRHINLSYHCTRIHIRKIPTHKLIFSAYTTQNKLFLVWVSDSKTHLILLIIKKIFSVFFMHS